MNEKVLGCLFADAQKIYSPKFKNKKIVSTKHTHYRINKNKLVTVVSKEEYDRLKFKLDTYIIRTVNGIKKLNKTPVVSVEKIHNDTVEECEARLSSLRHIKSFIDMNIRTRKEELKEVKQKLKEAKK